MKVYKLEIMVVEDGIDTIEEAMAVVECARFSNHVNIQVVTCKEADIGEWDDDNPLNRDDTQEQEMNRLFPIEKQT